MELTEEKLIPWNEYQDKDIKYFSGNATYSNLFEMTAEQANVPARLHIENIHDIARVWLNDNDLGILWTKPWVVDLSGFCKAGTNELRIEVTNCWSNRLIGDAGLPEKDRKVSTNVRLVPDRNNYPRGHQATSADDPLMPSGLIGPVSIEFGKTETINF